MKIQRIVVRNENKKIFEKENCSICTIDEDLSYNGTNKLLVMDELGCNVLDTYLDYKIVSIKKEIISFVAYNMRNRTYTRISIDIFL